MRPASSLPVLRRLADSHCFHRAVVCLLFAALLPYLFLHMTNDWDLHLFARNADTQAAQGLRGMYESIDIEYPPLAVSSILLSGWVARHLPEHEQWLTRYRAYDRPEPFRQFKVAHRLQMAAATVLTFVCLLVLVGRCYPAERPGEHTERLLAFVAGLGPLAWVLFDRLDMVLSALVVVSLLLLLSRRHWFWAFLALALAIDFKVAPLVLAPIWVLGALPLGSLAELRRGRGVLALLTAGIQRSAILFALSLGILAPYYVLAGPRCLYFLEFHQDRGIELASSYAAFLGLLKACGYQLTVQSSHGSADVIAPLAPLLTRVAPLLLGLLLLGATLLWFWAAVRRAAQGAEEQPVSRTLAHAFGPELAGFTLLFLLLFVLGNKVFSPQYLLWLAPLAALVPLAGWRRHVFLWGFVAVCVWNRQIFPGNLRELYGPILTMTPPTAAGPTPLGTFLLVGRTLALIGLTGLLTHGLLRRHRAVTSAAEAVSPGPRALPQLPQAAA